MLRKMLTAAGLLVAVLALVSCTDSKLPTSASDNGGTTPPDALSDGCKITRVDQYISNQDGKKIFENRWVVGGTADIALQIKNKNNMPPGNTCEYKTWAYEWELSTLPSKPDAHCTLIGQRDLPHRGVECDSGGWVTVRGGVRTGPGTGDIVNSVVDYEIVGIVAQTARPGVEPGDVILRWIPHVRQ